MRHHRLLLAAVVTAALGALWPAAPAFAIACENHTLTDASGFDWMTDAYLNAGNPAVDGVGYTAPYFDEYYATWYEAHEQYENGCAFEDGDRELRYPPMPVGGLQVSGTVFVPSSGPAFRRALVILHNPYDVPAGLGPRIYAEPEWLDADTAVVTTSSGDASGTAGDDWMVLENPNDGTDPRIAFAWNFGTDRRRSATFVFPFDEAETHPPFESGIQEMAVEFDTIVLQPGQTAAYLWIALVRNDAAEAEAAARELQAAPDALLAGLSDDERRMLQNVGLPDRDLDGLANGADNCPDAVNPGQENLDGDAPGDACDEDVDGDTVPNATETARGTDPLKPDTDGDGRRDDADVCPLRAGAGADGCALTDDPPPVPDTAAPGVTIRRIAARMRLRAFRRGVPCVVDLTEAAAVQCRLLVRALRGARIAAAGDLEVASRSLPLAAGRRSARLRPKRGLIRQRRFRAALQVTAIDAAGNRTVRTRRFRVRR